MYSIQSDQLIAQFRLKGAELVSLKHSGFGLEYIWQGDPTFWGKHSPVLFPIVGGLKENSYQLDGKNYSLPRHGFARDRDFKIEKQTSDQITFLLVSDEESKKVYPFDFELRIRYTLFDTTLLVTYDIINTSTTQTMWTSIGAHPAFNVPLDKTLNFDDYQLSFDEIEDVPIYPLTDQGLIKDQPIPFLAGDKLVLNKSLFYKDALVFKNLKSTQITLHTSKSPHGLDFGFEDFPYFGIWSAKNADFVCLEPWCGIADGEQHNQDLKTKEGIISLEPQQAFTRNWSVTVF